MAAYLFPIAVASLLAIFHHWGAIKSSKIGVTLFALIIGIISGIRFETAQDWPGYEKFFTDLDVKVSPLQSFLQHSDLPSFEIGFHLLNYFVKWLGGSYLEVSLLASIFCALALAKLLNQLSINRFYVLAIYCSYSYLLLHFAQVRQSIAVGIFLLAVAHYIKNRQLTSALSLALLAPMFQYSAALYVVLFLVAVKWPKKWGAVVTGVIVAVPIVLALVFRDFIDLYSLISKVAITEMAQAKIEIYQENQVAGGLGVILIAGYVFLMQIYQTARAKDVSQSQEFLFRLSSSFAIVTVIMIFAFPNSYVMFSRVYVACSVVQALANASLLRRADFALDSLAVYGSMLFSVAYFVRLFGFYLDEYLPFQNYIIRSNPWQ